MNKLPDKPSELLKLAMTDLEWVENNPNYEINMLDWHVPRDNGKCSACHAGAVMSNTLKVDNKYIGSPENSFDINTAEKLRAINAIRMGDISGFFVRMQLKRPENLPYDSGLCEGGYPPSTYSYLNPKTEPEKFQVYKDWIVSFIGILESEGL